LYLTSLYIFLLLQGQVPPYAQPQITQFAVQEALIKTVQSAVDSFGLKSLPGSDGEVKVHEEVSEMAKGYKSGDSLVFTANLQAVLPAGVTAAATTTAVDADIINAQVVTDEANV
jgi:hypothetical protein